jgi:hypothetical protein
VAEGRRSYVKEIVVAVVIALLAGGTAPWWWTSIFDNSPQPASNDQEGNGFILDGLPCKDPSVSLSRGSGPSGTHTVVRGSGFPSDEAVDVRFATETLPPARTDLEGAFEVEVVVPGTFDAFAPKQFEITATTKPTICFDSAPFLLTS